MRIAPTSLDRGLVREDSYHVGPALDLAVQALDGIGGVQLGAMFLGEGHVGQNVGLGIVPTGDPGNDRLRLSEILKGLRNTGNIYKVIRRLVATMSENTMI